MSEKVFSQNKIAIIWDFDKTLIPDYMQKPLFEHFNIDPAQFWKEVNTLHLYHKENGIDLVNSDTIYLNHMLSYVRAGKMKGLNNELFRQLGADLEFYPGLPNFFPNLKEKIKSNPRYGVHEIEIEHYVVSTGHRQMILGSILAPYVEDVWACEFVEDVPGPGYLEDDYEIPFNSRREISDVAYAIDNTSKTRAAFEINKGSNKHHIDVNASISKSDRRIPFKNMIYIADGPSDVPVFSVIKSNGGKTYAVYKSGEAKEFNQVKNLNDQGRVDSFGEANYTDGSQTSMWIETTAVEIAERIVAEKEAALGSKLGQAPGHINS